MTDEVKISGLPAASTLNGTEQWPIVQGGVTKKSLVSAIATYFAGRTIGAPVADIAALKSTSITGLQDSTLIYVAAVNNLFAWDSTCSEIADDLNFIKPDSISTGDGRWRAEILNRGYLLISSPTTTIKAPFPSAVSCNVSTNTLVITLEKFDAKKVRIGDIIEFTVTDGNSGSGNTVTVLNADGNPLISDLVSGEQCRLKIKAIGTTAAGDQVSAPVNEYLGAKDRKNGYAGMTNFKINVLDSNGVYTSFITNNNTASRTYTFNNRDGTIADNTDISGLQSQINTNTTSIGLLSNSKQNENDNLSALSTVGAADNGFLIKKGGTGSVGDIVTRTLVTGASSSTRLSIANGDCIAGNPAITLSEALLINATAITSAYSLLLTDMGYIRKVNSASNVTITCPKDATLNLPVGYSITFFQYGAGQVVLAPEDGTVNIRASDTALKTFNQYSVITVIKIASNEYLVTGRTAL